MYHKSSIIALLSQAAVITACTLPTTPPPPTITTPFRVQVQNASYPEIHNKFMNLLPSGGGDQHLYIGPVGDPTFDLTLVNGVITHNGIRAVIGGEDSEVDDTTKMFMTERGDPRAVYSPRYACNPVTDALQIELDFVGWQNHPAGGWICVRPTYDLAHEFRFYPPGNIKTDPARFCVKVTLVVFPSGGGTVSSSTTLSTSTTTAASSSSPNPPASSSTTVPPPSSSTTVAPPSSSSTTSVTPPTSTTSTTGTPSPLPYTDLTAQNFRFIGCSPEESHANDGPFRTLSGALYADDLLTGPKCTAFCSQRGYAFAGTEYRRECWCGNSYAATRQPGTTIASLAGCSMKCAGNNAQICGGGGWLSLYAACPVGGPCVNAVFT